MYLWRKVADPYWLTGREERLQARARGALAIMARPGRKRVQLEIACESRSQARYFIRDFGGWIEKLPHDWWRRLERDHKSKPLKIGKRVLIIRSPSDKELAGEKLETLIIPASAGLGTGEHPTTAMSLRLLEQISRGLKPGWSLVDLGTGSGILALAARCFGAEPVAAIDIDPTAVSTAKTNARLNRIANVDFQLGDVRRWNSVCKIDVVTANLFSELLIDAMRRDSLYFCLSLIWLTLVAGTMTFVKDRDAPVPKMIVTNVAPRVAEHRCRSADAANTWLERTPLGVRDWRSRLPRGRRRHCLGKP